MSKKSSAKKKLMTKEEFVKEMDEIQMDFNSWRNGIIAIIDTQRKNLWRADAFVMTFSQIIENPLARLVAKKEPPSSNLWAFNFAKKTQQHISDDLDKLKEIFTDLNTRKAEAIAEGTMEDGIFQMVPYLDKESLTIEDAWWGDITYQTIRPYGEKLNKIAEQLSERMTDLKTRYNEGREETEKDGAAEAEV